MSLTGGAPASSFDRLVSRLSAASVRRRWEAYRDISWDDATSQLDPADARWVLADWDPVGASTWYRDQAEATRSRLGLLRVLALLKVGIEFEAVLQRGLLVFASGLPDRHPAFRYVYHEITEEAQHSMMFQELINRSGVEVPSSPASAGALFDTVLGDVEDDWSMFFLAALTAEEVLDQLQRRFLRQTAIHPLFRRICEIHVAEEARHMTFARAYLAGSVPAQTGKQRRLTRFRAPFVVEWITRHVVEPPALDHLLPADRGAASVEERQALACQAQRLRTSCAAGVVQLCQRLDLVDERLAGRWASIDGSPGDGRACT